MTQFRQLRLTHASKLLADAASLQNHPGWKIALTGANSAEKSNGFWFLHGQRRPNHGNFELLSGGAITRVVQETSAL